MTIPSAQLNAKLLWCFENNVTITVDNTTPIYLINLLWKLALGI